MEYFRWHNATTRWIKTTDGRITCIGVLKKGPSWFIILNNDTITDPLWNSEIVSDVDLLDTTYYRYVNPKLYDERSLAEVIPACGSDDSGFFVINLQTTENYHAIGIGTVHVVNMDSDRNDEYVVEIAGGGRTRYCFFDDSTSRWKSYGEMESHARWSFCEIDSHLNGYAGFVDEMWGSGKGSKNYDYYRLENDSLRLCFTINGEYGCSEFHWAGYNQSIISSSESRIVNGKIVVTHHTTYEMSDSTYKTVFQCTDNTQYEFIPTPSGRYKPYPRLEAFDNSYDSTLFNPVFAISKKVDVEKKTGSRREKDLLKNISVGSALFL